MTNDTTNGAGGDKPEGEQQTAKAAPQAQAQPQAVPQPQVLAQYVKDLSFENPRAPQGMRPEDGRPEIQVQVDVRAQQMDADRYEVVLELKAEAKAKEQSVFIVELTYGGVFGLSGVPSEQRPLFLMIECPRLLFPFARRIVGDATRDGGLPPLMIDPIDFVALYRRRLEAAQQQQAAKAPATEAPAAD